MCVGHIWTNCTLAGLDFCSGCVVGHGNGDDYVQGEQLLVEGALHCHLDLEPGPAKLIDDRDDAEGQGDVLVAAVLHELEFAIRRHKADYFLGVESAQIHALVERHILHKTYANER